MEDEILSDEKVKSMISKNYVYFSAYVDDRRRDANNTLSTGEKYQKIQSEEFKSNSQPYFVILDSQGKAIAAIGYTAKTEEFLEFLTKGLK